MSDLEQRDDVVGEAARGRSGRTPLILGLGMHVIVGAAVAVVLGLAFLAYYLAR